MTKYVIRTNYLNKLREFREKKVIKVITGVRRSGKSVLMEHFQNEIKESGIQQRNIVYLNFEQLENEELLEYHKLYNYIVERLNPNGWTYIFLDEIQMVDNFQKTIDSLQTKEKVDIYITGSNSHLLSGELATLLSGRYVQIHILPLSFKEFIDAKSNLGKPTPSIPLKKEFKEYMMYGSFPQIIDLQSSQSINTYLDSVYNTVVVKDILTRGAIQEGILRSIVKFVFHSIGSEISITNIVNTLKSNKREVSYNTVEKYLNLLKESYIIYEVPKYDIKGKQHLKQNNKYYVVDVGLRNMLLSNSQTDIGHVLENIIYLELIRRGYKVSVGKILGVEVDFVAQNDKGVQYFQVSSSILDSTTRDREIKPFDSIKDHYPKTIITLDDYLLSETINGIKVINAIDFLLEDY